MKRSIFVTLFVTLSGASVHPAQAQVSSPLDIHFRRQAVRRLVFDRDSAISLCMLKPARVVNLSVEYPTIEASGAKPLVLATGDIRIVCSDKEAGPLKIALRALKEDFRRVMDTETLVSDTMDRDNAKPEIVIVNRGSGALPAPSNKIKPLDGFESHRVYADRDANRIYLEGHDLRGTIYAIYTFSEQVLGVPPLHYWCSWVPKKKDRVEIPADFDLYFRSPQVRYRSILPGDQDFFMPWKKRSAEHQNVWLETTLRLKLNTVETYSTIKPGYRLTEYAYLIGKYGLVITAHHICALNIEHVVLHMGDLLARGPPPGSPQTAAGHRGREVDAFSGAHALLRTVTGLAINRTVSLSQWHRLQSHAGPGH